MTGISNDAKKGDMEDYCASVRGFANSVCGLTEASVQVIIQTSLSFFFLFFFLLNQNSGLWWHKFSGCLKTIRHIDVSLQKSNTSIFTKKEIYTSCTELSIYLNQVGPCHHLTAHILEAEF